MTIDDLNRAYSPLSPQERIAKLYTDIQHILLTSSFGTSSVWLLHLFSKVQKDQAVHFLDTGYHFPETLAYRDTLKELFQLHIVNLKGDEWRAQFTTTDRTWEKDPDLCCSINKVEPLEAIKTKFEVWVSGLMKSQNEHRSQLRVFEERGGILKFYPIIDQTEKQVFEAISSNGLPEHPLKNKGFLSVGCTHCTAEGKAREGRWINKSKTECGLHL
jgi:phosphoadenosine phosphosulfate reductase